MILLSILLNEVKSKLFLYLIFMKKILRLFIYIPYFQNK